MLDGRKALENQRYLQMDEKTEYKIVKEIGRGASCIVYEAGYVDNIGHFHTVRIKECYPFYIKLIRDQEGNLCPIEDEESRFEDAKKKFYDAYSRNVKLHEKMGFMNSTVDSENIYEKNNTYYTVMSCKEGMDYSKAGDEDLKSVFERMLTLAKLIKKYHDQGILYLDIKPENVLILPETKEQIVLFDFDSVIEKNALKSKEKIIISYSDGFSAPELVKGNKRKISEASDIYSIGAMVYYKIFGKVPTTKECSYGYKFDFQILKDQEVCYSRELFVLLEQFLKKTIALTVGYRYKTMDRVIEDLEKLVRAADVSATYLLSNFVYNFAGFVGRRAEIEQIKGVFDAKQQLVFLSGMGGIGKTELAKRYAYEQEDRYRNIVFATFQGSLEKTLCSDEIQINHVEQGNEESNEEYRKRKLQVLKKVTSKDDLIIIDNFDVDYDEHLEDLLECPCKFIFTTRMDFRDYDYEQMEVSEIDDMKEMRKIFHKNNDYEYEEESVRELIHLVEHHTMTVVLLAKYLRMTDTEIDEMLARMLEIKGVTNTENVRVKHRKDKRLKAESINRHMLLLFNITNFTPAEKEFLMSLSLLGPVYVKKDFLLEACQVEGGNHCLQKLIQYGWVLYDSVREKITLHQVILDVIYNNLHPDSQKCVHMLEFMYDYFGKELETFTDRNNRENLAEHFMERMRGNDYAYARLCEQYCRQIHFQEKYIQKAEEICKELSDQQGKYLLYQIYCLKMEKIGSFEAFYEAMKRDEEEEDFFRKAAKDICKYAEQAFDIIRQLDGEGFSAAELSISLAYIIDQICMDPIFTQNTEKYMEQMLDYAVFLLDYGECTLAMQPMDDDKKVALLRKIQDFYKENGTFSFREERYHNADQVLYYQKLIEGLNEEYDYFFTYEELGDHAKKEQKYEQAISFYYKAIQEEEGFVGEIERKIAGLYWELGQKEKAILLMEETLQRTDVLCPDHLYAELCSMYVRLGKWKEAEAYKEKITDQEAKILACYELYKYAEKGLQLLYWRQCMREFEQHPDKEYPAEFTELLLKILEKEPDGKLRLEKGFQYLESIDFAYEEERKLFYLKKLLGICKEEEDFHREVQVLLLVSRCLLEEWVGEEEQALSYGMAAREKYDAYHIEDLYLWNSILKQLEKVYLNLDEYQKRIEIMKQCDYGLLAACDSENLFVENVLELWEEAAESYGYVEKYEESIGCYEKILGLFDQGNPDYLKYQEKIVRQYYKLGDKENMACSCQKLYEYTLNQVDTTEREWLREYLRICGRYFNMLGWVEKALAAYIQAITAPKLEMKLEKLPKYLKALENTKFEKVKWIVEDICDLLEQLPHKKQEMEELKMCLLRYQNQEMEFKR